MKFPRFARRIFLSLLAALSPLAAQPARLANISTRGQVGADANNLFGGFAITGGAKTVLVRAIGPGLGVFGVQGTLPDPTLTVFDSKNAVVASNDNWNVTDTATFTSVGAFPLPTSSRDAVVVVTLQPGSYSAQISGLGSPNTGVALLEVYDVSGGGQLVNIATRLQVGTGTDAAGAGFVVAPGTGTRKLLIRGIGPALTAFGVPGALPDPKVELLDTRQSTLATATANGGASVLATASAQAGAFALSANDAAVIATVAAGSISLAGSNSFQRGTTVAPYSVAPFGAPVMYLAGNANNYRTRDTALRNVLANSPANLLEAAFGGITQDAWNDSETLRGVLQTAPKLNTSFPGTSTASQLAMVVKLISVAPTLGLKRQIFFVELGGWDLHAAQSTGHGPLLAETSAAMKAFYDVTVELGVANQVTTFTASDFGRTYVPNAGGTDHGWGNHQLIMGGAVQGGDIYGTMPSLIVGANDDTGRGRWIPSTSVDEYSATLARWFGVSDTNLPLVLPNIGRFAKPNLGFMG